MSNEIHKEMTVYDLANLMMKGFGRLEKRVDGTDAKIEEVKEELAELRNDFNLNEKATDHRIDTAEHRLVVIKNVIEQDLNVPVRW